MYVRKIKRRCGVRGCKSIEAFAISKTREAGNSIIICKECLKEANKSVAELKPNEKSNVKKTKEANIPGLFFNTQIKDMQEANKVSENEGKDEEETTDSIKEPELDEKETTEFKCPGCGKVFESEKGLKSHLRYCDKA